MKGCEVTALKNGYEVIRLKRVKFLYNPASGDGKMVKQLDTVFRIYQNFGYLVDVLRLDEAVRGERLFPEPKGYYDHVLVAGGDGTCDSIVNELLAEGHDTPVAFLPMGTANDYATYIGMSPNVEDSLRQILTLPPQRMDLGKVNDRYFLNVFSCGHFADISQKTGDDLKTNIGILAYFIKSVEKLRDFKPVRVKVRTGEDHYEGDMLLCTVFNGVSVGNMRLALKAHGNDGKLDLILLKAGHLGEIGPTILRVLRGDEKALYDPSLYYIQTDDVTIESAEPIPSDIDGEKGPELPVRIQCIKGAITVLGVRGSI